jgi:hypothetical protein
MAPAAHYAEVDAETTPDQLNDIINQVEMASSVLLAIAVTPAAWQRFGLQPAQEQFVAQLTETAPALIAAALGSPHVLDAVPHAHARLCTYSDVPEAQRALAAHVLRS